VPLVSTRAGAVPELLDEGALGALVDVGDDAGLAEAILSALADLPAARARAARAVEKTASMSAARVVERYLALFDSPTA
jgi:glycosyltransferase involved in cell wall biosynthesis